MKSNDEGFRDPMEALRIRNWVGDALTAAGGEISGGGIAFMERTADLDFTYNGRHYWIELKDIGPARRSSKSKESKEDALQSSSGTVVQLRSDAT